VTIYLELHGSLRRVATEPDGRTARVELAAGARVADALAAAGLPLHDVWRVARRGELVEVASLVCDGDRLAVFPPLGGGASHRGV
jgi:sulfur carrier protein ThiS